MVDENEARAALSSVQDVQDRLVENQRVMPFWRHAAFGVLGAVLVIGMAMNPPLSTATLAVSFMLIVLLTRSDRNRYGTFVNGWRAGRTLPISLILLGGLLALCAYAFRHRGDPFPTGEGWLAAGIGFIFSTLMSMVWQSVYLRDLRRGGGR